MATGSEPLVIRRRRSAERRLARRRARIWTTTNQLAVAVIFWSALGWLVFAQDPDNAVARAAFFIALLGALFFTLSPLIRAISLQFARSRLYQEAVTMHAARQALMISVFLVLNGLLQMQRAWNGLIALLLFSVLAIIEIVSLARR